MDANAVHRAWLHRSGEFSPCYYAYHGPNETSELLCELFDSLVSRDAAILELGCSSGRHLSHLHEHGYLDVTGVDINDDAFDVMRDTSPDLAAAGTFYADAIEDVITEFADGRFDAVYSVETFQHLHPDSEWVFKEVARITDDVLVTVEIEGDEEHGPMAQPAVTYVDDAFPLYYRNWNRVFAEFGLAEVDSRVVGRDTARVFRAGDRQSARSSGTGRRPGRPNRH